MICELCNCHISETKLEEAVTDVARGDIGHTFNSEYDLVHHGATTRVRVCQRHYDMVIASKPAVPVKVCATCGNQRPVLVARYSGKQIRQHGYPASGVKLPGERLSLSFHPYDYPPLCEVCHDIVGDNIALEDERFKQATKASAKAHHANSNGIVGFRRLAPTPGDGPEVPCDVCGKARIVGTRGGLPPQPLVADVIASGHLTENVLDQIIAARGRDGTVPLCVRCNEAIIDKSMWQRKLEQHHALHGLPPPNRPPE